MQKQEFETIISEQLALFKNLKKEFISQKDFEMAVSLRGIEKYLIDIQRIIENKREIPQIEVSPNFFKSNYSVGRFHTAIIAYIIELWNDERSNLANIIFEDCFEKGKKYYPKFEYDSIDLVVFEDEKYQTPILFIEMKIHDYEYWSQSQGLNQLQIYDNKIKNKFGDNKSGKFFFTLGISQYSGSPSSEEWTPFTIDSLVKKLSKYEGEDMFITGWRSSLRDEYKFKNNIFENRYDPRQDSNKNKAQIYRLGQLKEFLQKAFITKYDKCSAFMYGTAPDLILNFGYGSKENPVYMEITNNLMVNLKVSILKLPNNKENPLEEFYNIIGSINSSEIDDFKLIKGKTGKTMTFYRGDIGLNNDNFFSVDFNSSYEIFNKIEKLRRFLEKITLKYNLPKQ